MATTTKNIADLEYEKKLRQYIIKAFLSEISKILLFLLISIYLNLVKEYFAALFFLMVLRNTGGGLHFKHYFSCLFVSFIFLYSSILFAYIWQPQRMLLLFILLICIFLGPRLVPVTSSNRPPATDQQIRNSKKNTFFLISLFWIVICTCPLNLYLYIGFWTIFLHIFQLLIAHMKGVIKNDGLGHPL